VSLSVDRRESLPWRLAICGLLPVFPIVLSCYLGRFVGTCWPAAAVVLLASTLVVRFAGIRAIEQRWFAVGAAVTTVALAGAIGSHFDWALVFFASQWAFLVAHVVFGSEVLRPVLSRSAAGYAILGVTAGSALLLRWIPFGFPRAGAVVSVAVAGVCSFGWALLAIWGLLRGKRIP